MRRGTPSREELLARKLVRWVTGFLCILTFAGFIFHVASQPPAPPEGNEEVQTPPAVLPDLQLQAFRDRLARVRLAGWPLEERKAEAQRLLRTAPTAELRAEAQRLLQDLKREEQYQRLLALQGLRRRVRKLAEEGDFTAASQLISEFRRKNPGLAAQLRQVEAELQRTKRRTFLEIAQQAETAIAAGDAQMAAELAGKALPLAPEEKREEVLAWPKRARARAEELAALKEKPHPVSPSQPPAETASPQAQPHEKAVPEQPPAQEPPGGRIFEGVVTAQANERVRDSEGRLYVLDAGEADIFADKLLPPEALGNEVDRGTGLWIFGRAVERKGLLRPFGRTVARTIEDVSLAVLDGTILPRHASGKQKAAWLFGKVELAFPVLRVTLEDGKTFFVSSRTVPVVKRAQLPILPPIKEGATLYVEGRVNGETLRADKVILLAASLAKNPAYLDICR